MIHHGFVGRVGTDAELGKYPIAFPVHSMLYVVWYFVSGCFLLFGVVIIRDWYLVRKGNGSLLFVVDLIGLLWAAVGVSGMIYPKGDPFMGVFIVEGLLLLASAYTLHATAPKAG